MVDHLFSGLSGLVTAAAGIFTVLGLGSFAISLFRHHPYLFSIDSRRQAGKIWIDLLIPLARRLQAPRYRRFVKSLLNRSSPKHVDDASPFIALQIGVSMIGLFGLVAIALMFGWSLLTALLIGGVAFMLPLIRLHERASQRFRLMNRELPYFIDYLTLAMGAGLDFNQALTTVVADAKSSPLADEFKMVLRNIRLGMSRREALEALDLKIDSPPLKLFIHTTVQSMEMGSDVVSTLDVMSDTLQKRRFQAAEEAAGKISVKMMIPMMCFVLPSVMIILLGPMILSSELF